MRVKVTATNPDATTGASASARERHRPQLTAGEHHRPERHRHPTASADAERHSGHLVGRRQHLRLSVAARRRRRATRTSPAPRARATRWASPTRTARSACSSRPPTLTARSAPRARPPPPSPPRRRPTRWRRPSPALRSAPTRCPATQGTWSGIGNTYTYQWQRSADGSTWNDILAATALTYTLAAADEGNQVRLQATASTPTTHSASKAPRALPSPAHRRSTRPLPAVTGTAARASTLTVGQGAWSGLRTATPTSGSAPPTPPAGRTSSAPPPPPTNRDWRREQLPPRPSARPTRTAPPPRRATATALIARLRPSAPPHRRSPEPPSAPRP